MYKLTKQVYVKQGKFGWVATYIDNDQFIEVRPANKEDMPKEEGYYEVVSEKGFRRFEGPTGKVSVYANGKTEFHKANKIDEDLSVAV